MDIDIQETVRRNLNRLTQVGVLRRILKGVYEKPKYSKLLEEYVAPNPDAVAKALARSYHWTIVPCGNTALNLLGLSTQVTAIWSYASDGPYKTYKWNTTKLEFKHKTNKEISGLSYMTRLVVQALKALGKSNVTPVQKEYFGQFFIYRDGFTGKESLHRLGRRQCSSRQDFYTIGENANHRLAPLNLFLQRIASLNI